jgi:hypothetical protein
MEKEKLESLLIDYIDNKLNSVDRHVVEQELVRNAESYKLYEELKEVMHVMDRSARFEPSHKLKAGFEDLLKEELTSQRSAKTVFFQPAIYRAAAAVALLIIGGTIGFHINEQNNRRLAEIEEKLNAQEAILKATTNRMMAMLNNGESASQRMQGAKVALEINKADAEIVNALVKAMHEDPSSNVRLAALEALSKFSGDARVKRELIRSLSLQKDPLVQISLIQLLVRMQEKGVVDDLQKIVDDEGTIQAVKDEAYSGILRLS